MAFPGHASGAPAARIAQARAVGGVPELAGRARMIPAVLERRRVRPAVRPDVPKRPSWTHTQLAYSARAARARPG
jgi:hypothetical protein